MNKQYGLVRLYNLDVVEGHKIRCVIQDYFGGSVGVALLDGPDNEKAIIVYPLSSDQETGLRASAVRGNFISFLRNKYDASLKSIFLASEVKDEESH